jgi:hypothetical protein
MGDRVRRVALVGVLDEGLKEGGRQCLLVIGRGVQVVKGPHAEGPDGGRSLWQSGR